MGKKINTNLPNGMRARKRQRKNGDIITYYFYEKIENGKRKEIALGTNYILAVQEWAKLEQSKINHYDRPTFSMITTRYLAEGIKDLEINTQKTKKTHVNNLNKVFGNAFLDDIAPKHIRQYLDMRSNTPAAANNEISTFSVIWNCAREWGYTDRANPCVGVKRHKVKRRDNYVENDLYQFVYQHADQTVKDLMDISYLTGQRPIDLVKLHSSNIQDGILNIKQKKTKAKLRFEITGELKNILDRIMPDKPDFLFRNQKGGILQRNVLTK